MKKTRFNNQLNATASVQEVAKPELSDFSKPSHTHPVTRVNQVAILAALVGLFALIFPFMSLFTTRVLPIGEAVQLGALPILHGISSWGMLILIGWFVVMISACWIHRKAGQIIFLFSGTLTAALLLCASTFATEHLVSDELSRVSFSTGAWLSALAVYILFFSFYQQIKIWVLLPILIMLAIALWAPYEHWGIYREYMAAPEAFIIELKQHLFMLISALPLIILIGTALGYVASQYAWLEDMILSLNGFMQTVPSIALYGLLLPLLTFIGQSLSLGQSVIFLLAILVVIFILALIAYRVNAIQSKNKIKSSIWLLVFMTVIVALPILCLSIYQLITQAPTWLAQLSWNTTWDTLGMRGLGVTPALIALVLYGVFPLIVNVHSSIQNISADLIDAAKGLGFSRAQIFWKVQLPLILPYFIDGIRLSCLMLISLATIAVLVNAGGLGVFLMRGTEQSVQDLILLGTIPAVILALLIDAILRVVQYWLTPKGIRT